MFEDEEELELLRQYEEAECNAVRSSDDELDEDLEDTIMSMVQYGTGTKEVPKKQVPKPENPTERVNQAEDQIQIGNVHLSSDNESNGSSAAFHSDASDDSDIDSDDAQSQANDVSAAASEESGNDDDDGDEDNNSDDKEPHVTRYINLDLEQQPKYMDEEEEDEEEAELNEKLQKLIDEQIKGRQRRTKISNRKIQVCFACFRPGHERRDCNVCADCGGQKHRTNCPGLKYCNRCKRRGHQQMECTYAYESGSCQLCGLRYHSTVHCPSILHCYENEKPPERTPVVYCYNCAARGHYGDECPDLPAYLEHVQSAFSDDPLCESTRLSKSQQMKLSAKSFGKHMEGYSSRNHVRFDSGSSDGSQRSVGSNNNHKRTRQHHQFHNDNSSNRTRMGGPPAMGAPSPINRPAHQHAQEHHRNWKPYAKPGPGKGRSQAASRDNYGLDSFFEPRRSQHMAKPPANRYPQPQQVQTKLQRGTGSTNWNAIPKPTSSGTVNISSRLDRSGGGGGRGVGQSMDFVRGPVDPLPKPSSSGVIDLPLGFSPNGPPPTRGPRYRGGYGSRR